MVPEASLATASYVLIEEEIPALDETVVTDPGETPDETPDETPMPNWSRRVMKKWRRIMKQFRTASQKSIIAIELTDDGDRFIEYTCMRYVYDGKEDRFRPAADLTDITPAESERLLALGGLNQTEAIRRRAFIGPNEIVVDVPSIFKSLITEFSSLFYVIQSMGAWTCLGYSAWNIGVLWFLTIIITGGVKALSIVRRGQKKVAELAHHSTNVSVLRNSEWSVIPSSDVALSDIMKVDDAEIPCDGHILLGAAVVNESMLTGEPMPVQKIAADSSGSGDTSFTSKSLIHAGTLCMESTGPYGKALMIVTAVGGSTTKGQLIRMVMFPQSVR
ncbi:conserved hypothetical protein [Perkinsus marinus ATCC 50983]|uniref:Uncharacterized protein n=1 Tax=Perkinsus marinus (strain ATCC 50983 / TXsc) TaxID=423536 RepID=C5LAK7_PERM5|nr:conserved hypothetical protein [Perkinsus marinus ATCC 50983]EER06463.1 conserved hypothetical protein [Perkinsus marinus ATCC 50983]|eukprot:XP_002774647.1 conserved hypothetical protein [Perkinsus marinus ATCC 50983]